MKTNPSLVPCAGLGALSQADRAVHITFHLTSPNTLHPLPHSPLFFVHLCSVLPPDLFSAALPGGNAFPLFSRMAASGGSRQGGPSWCCQKKITSNSRYWCEQLPTAAAALGGQMRRDLGRTETAARGAERGGEREQRF